MQHIVLVDDSSLNLRTHALLLERLPDVEIQCFGTSREALEWATFHDVDCFIVDYHMPEPDGVEVTRRLREQPAHWLTPIIIVTSDRERSVRYAALDAGVDDFVEKPVDPREFVVRIKHFLALQDARKRLDGYLGDVASHLRDEERQSRELAERLDVLWKIATNPLFDGDEKLGAVLTQSAIAVRPAEAFLACLFRIEGDEAVLEALGDFAGEMPGPAKMAIGTRVPRIMPPRVSGRDSDVAMMWDDLAEHPELTMFAGLRTLGIRSHVVVPFRAAGNEFVLTYSSLQKTKRSFGSTDVRYTTIVAAFLQHLFQERWQSERITYQQQFDALTGLMNRSRFRALTRAACIDESLCSLAIVDVMRFSEINRKYGNLHGDALLVEVAAGLSQHAAATGDFVGRLGGDNFGICLPGVATEEAAHERLAAYLGVFDKPFSTGDRAGTEFIGLDARIGACVAEAGLSFSDLLTRSDLALKSLRDVTASSVAVYHPERQGDVALIT